MNKLNQVAMKGIGVGRKSDFTPNSPNQNNKIHISKPNADHLGPSI
jgi:hypothetical protein